MIANKSIIRIDYVLEFFLLCQVIYRLKDNGIYAQQSGANGLTVPTDANVPAERILIHSYFPDKEAITDLKSIRRKLRSLFSRIQTFCLCGRIPDGGCRYNILGLDFLISPGTHIFDDRFVCAIDCAERTCYQMQLVLDNQFGRKERTYRSQR